MKQLTNRFEFKAFISTVILCLFAVITQAQNNADVKINGEPIGSWISRNWMWVAGGVVLLLLLIGVLSSGKRTRSKTTIVREEDASGIVRTTTTEIKD